MSSLWSTGQGTHNVPPIYMTKQIVRVLSMVANPSVTQLFALNIYSWDINLTLGQPHSAMQKKHYGGPPLNSSALSNYN
jgi:hypothetical protein